MAAVRTVCHFFFQAEDGIRDLVRSRGLGYVYKRQDRRAALLGPFGQRLGEVGGVGAAVLREPDRADEIVGADEGIAPVSYTHLTLPTSDLV